MDNIFQILLNHQFVQSNSLNFLIVLAFLLWVISKVRIGQKIEHQQNQIKFYVEEAENEKSNARDRLDEINNKIRDLRNDIGEIERSANNSIESLTLKSQENIKEKTQDIDNNVKRILDLETKKFKSKLTAVISEASVNLAKDNALKQLENNRKLHDKYIYEAINEIDGIVL